MLPQLRQLEREFDGRLVVIGVHSAKFMAERATENLREAVLRYGVDHPVVNDRDFSVWNSYAVRAWPTLMFIDPEGRVVGRHEGEAPLEALRQVAGEMLAEYEARGLLDAGAPLPLRREAAASDSVLAFPGKVAADVHTGRRLAVADTNHDRVLVVSPAGEPLRVLSGLRSPQGVAFDPEGRLWIAETGAHSIAVADLDTGEVSRVAGTGRAAMTAEDLAAGALRSPWDLAWLEGALYIAMAGSHQVWRLEPGGPCEPFAGSGREGLRDGTLEEAWLAQPSGLASGADTLWVADSEVSAVRRVDPARRAVETSVGLGLFEFGDEDGAGEEVRLQHPLGVAWWEGRVLIADSYNSKVKLLDPESRRVTTLAGRGEPGLAGGAGAEAAFNEPGGLCVLGGAAFVADTNNHLVRRLDLATRDVSTLDLAGS